ncbi:MAG: CHAP domain-containing protein [Gammaproteobacteria bacterium]|nr:MAG: CHAP domain-containing protein [Gammaproteobacteria bacterium]
MKQYFPAPLFQRAFFASLLMLLTFAGIAETKDIPATCKMDCMTPYGQVLGKDKSGVTGYSNCNSDCVIFEPNKHDGTYTGIKWQCVEYARRWLLVNKGVVYGDVDYAIDIWDKIDHYRNVQWDEKVPVTNHVNGSETAPEPGDLLIYAKVMFGGTGHVAVITEVDEKKGIVRVAEQNNLNQQWPSTHSREISLIKNGNQYWLLDGYLIGWKRAGI